MQRRRQGCRPGDLRWWLLAAALVAFAAQAAAQPESGRTPAPGETAEEKTEETTEAARAAGPEERPKVGVVEAEDFDIVFPGDRYQFLVPHVGGSVRNALQFHQELYDWQPTEKPTIFLNDFSDFGGGTANTVPTNIVRIGVAPFSYTYETMPAMDRMFWLSNHETAHLVTMDQATGRDLAWRKFFSGKVWPDADDPLTLLYNYLTNPRWNAPDWYHEGIAVFLETWMAGGIGRGQGAYDEMVFRSMVLDGSHIYESVGLESEGVATDFQAMANAYLYGTRFVTYLAYVHGPESVVEWTARRPGSKAYFADQFENVYGVPLEEEWRRWIAFEKEWQAENLAAIRKNPITPYRDLSPTALGSVSRTFIDREARKMYVAIRYPGQMAHLAEIDLDTGKLRRLRDIKGAATYYVTSIAFDPETRTFFLTSDNRGWRDLWSLDLRTGKSRRLAANFRTGDLAWNRADRSLWGIQHHNGASVLVRIPEPYDRWQTVHTFPYGSDLYDIDVAPDGRSLVGGMAEIDGSQRLVRLEMRDLARRRVEPETLFDFGGSLAANFTFSPDGKNLYGSSYYSGVSNIYRYDLEKREMFVMSNVETGLFRPQVLSDEELLAFRYTGDGFVPVAVPNRDIENVSAVRFLGTALVREKPVLEQWAVGSPREVGYVGSEPREFSTLRRMKVASFHPIVEGYKSSEAAGMKLNLSDALRQSNLAIAASFSPDDELDDDEKLHLDVELDHWKWNFRGTWNRADFYDLFGPTKESRKGWSLGYRWDDVVIFDDPRFLRMSTGGEHWGDLETLPDFQNVEATAQELDTVWARVEFEHRRESQGAVDEEKGIHAALEAVVDYVNDDTIPRLYGTLDRGWALPLHHSSLWLRSSGGYAFGSVDDDFSRFFFGGFGNNYVDHRSEKRYREYYAFPGLELNEVGGRSFAKTMLEWNLPPIRFRKAGARQFFVNWMRPALFAGVLATDPDQSRLDRTLQTVGAQIDFKTILFSNLPSFISIGYGVAFEDGESSDEVMISLKIL